MRLGLASTRKTVLDRITLKRLKRRSLMKKWTLMMLTKDIGISTMASDQMKTAPVISSQKHQGPFNSKNLLLKESDKHETP
jgi:hypothetical protein